MTSIATVVTDHCTLMIAIIAIYGSSILQYIVGVLVSFTDYVYVLLRNSNRDDYILGLFAINRGAVRLITQKKSFFFGREDILN